jgi:hypothetical protein
MKSFGVIAAAFAFSSVVGAAHGQTALKPGLWEVTDKTTMEGVQPMPATSQRICLKTGEATLERLLYPPPEEFAKHGCTFQPTPRQAGTFKATTVCPATEDLPGVTATAEISYKPDSYEGLGQLLLKDKAGTTVKGSSVMSGKRVGDC